MEEEKKRVCPHCLCGALIWDSDCDACDIGYSVDGIVTLMHCTECGAEIEILAPAENIYKERENEK